MLFDRRLALPISVLPSLEVRSSGAVALKLIYKLFQAGCANTCRACQRLSRRLDFPFEDLQVGGKPFVMPWETPSRLPCSFSRSAISQARLAGCQLKGCWLPITPTRRASWLMPKEITPSIGRAHRARQCRTTEWSQSRRELQKPRSKSSKLCSAGTKAHSKARPHAATTRRRS